MFRWLFRCRFRRGVGTRAWACPGPGRPGRAIRYYDRKVAEGKHKMLVFNAMRNKLIHRVCAVIRKGVPYEIRTPLANVIE